VKSEDLDTAGNRCVGCVWNLLVSVDARVCAAAMAGCRTGEGGTRARSSRIDIGLVMLGYACEWTAGLRVKMQLSQEEPR